MAFVWEAVKPTGTIFLDIQSQCCPPTAAAIKQEANPAATVLAAVHDLVASG